MTPCWLSCLLSSSFSGQTSDMVFPRRVPTGRRPVGRRAQRARTRGAHRPSRCSSHEGCSSKEGRGGASGAADQPHPGRCWRALAPYRLTRLRRISTAAHGGLRPRRSCRKALRCSPPRRWAPRRGSRMQSAVAAWLDADRCTSTAAAPGKLPAAAGRLSAAATAAAASQHRRAEAEEARPRTCCCYAAPGTASPGAARTLFRRMRQCAQPAC